MMDIQPTDLRYFFEVAKTQNVSRAAERLNIGQPALSQSIRRLETVVGTRLLDRFKTGVRLTVAGQRLLDEGRVAIEKWECLKNAVRSSEHEIEGSYSIGCHVSVGIYSLPTVLRDIFGKHPRLEIKITHGLSREIAESVVSFRTDFGLVINPVRHPDLVIRELCEDRVAFWAAKTSHQDILICDPALAQSQTLIKRKALEKSFNRYLYSSSLELIATLAAGGCGVAILPERIARRYSGLSLWRADLPIVRDRLCLIYRSDRHLTAAARVIVDSIGGAEI
jgi:DNA-binding transcriptional LysR family regulator